MSYSKSSELSRTKRRGKGYTLEEALNKVYIIKARGRTDSSKLAGWLNLPKCMIGQRVKLVVVKEGKK